MQPGTVSAYGDILKTLLPIILSLNPVLIITGLITFVGGMGISKSIKTLEAKAGQTPLSIEELNKFKNALSAELDLKTKDALAKFENMGKTFTDKVEKSQKDTIEALDQAKIRAMRLKDMTDEKIQNLSHVVSTQDAIERRFKRLENVYANEILKAKRREISDSIA